MPEWRLSRIFIHFGPEDLCIPQRTSACVRIYSDLCASTSSLAVTKFSPNYTKATIDTRHVHLDAMCSCYSSASSAARNGFAISSRPSSGDTRLTCVPLTTTRPSFLVFSVILFISSGSIISPRVWCRCNEHALHERGGELSMGKGSDSNTY